MMAPYLAAADVATDEAAADDDRKPALLNDDGTTFAHGDENSSSGSGEQFFLPSENVVGLTRGRGATTVGSGGKLARRKKLQHFLGQIKQLMVSQRSGTNLEKTRQQRRMRLGTLDALDQALQVLRQHSLPETRRPTEANSSGFSSSPASPDSPSSSADSSSACLAVPSEEPVPKDQIASNQLPMNEDGDELLKPQSCPSSSSATCPAAAAAPPMLGRRFLGTLFVSLPEGAVLECRDAGAHQPAEGGVTGQLMSAIIRPGDSLLALLHGKGAQTMLLNAFCGHPRRRMYARLKWGNDTTVRACELLCEFSVDPQCVARRLASIQLFCVQSGAALLTSLPAIQQPQQQQKPAALTFTTRHNSGCALIYLDSASIPLLGHFPSEVTGKSLFTLVHPEDARRLRDAHQQLHSTGGQQQQQQIVRTPGLRLLAHSGQPVPVDSEWAAFVNPWTRHIEMVVGRHTFQATAGATQMQTIEASMATAAAQQLREEQAAFVHSLLAEPVPQLGLPMGKVEMPLMKEEPREEEQQQQQQQKFATTSSIFPAQQQQQQQVQLSYTQINCLENVHRLLKSQSQSRADTDEEAASRQSKDSIMMPKCEPSSFLQPSNEANNSSPNSMAPNSISQNAHLLTRELLQLHDQRWEEECRDSWRRRLSATGGSHRLKRCAADRPLLVEQHSPPPAKQFRRSSDGWLLMDNHNNSSSHGFEQPQLLNFQPQQQQPSRSPPIFPTNPSAPAALMLDNGGSSMDLQLLRCLLAQQQNQQQQQSSIASPQLLLDHLLQAANVARNTLAIQLMQQQ